VDDEATRRVWNRATILLFGVCSVAMRILRHGSSVQLLLNRYKEHRRRAFSCSGDEQ
jgi:hypothetical protein